jgi:hypothetical protein
MLNVVSLNVIILNVVAPVLYTRKIVCLSKANHFKSG